MIEKIKKHENETFYTVTNLPFTYRIKGGSVIIEREGREINRVIPLSEFEKAKQFNPKRVKDIVNIIQAACYVFAIINDKRIKE